MQPEPPEPLNPLISIVVPVYNEARTVAEVIERLIAIDLPAPREILVVNDGSTDGTREVLDQVAQRPELRIIHAEKNGGKGSAIRIGFAQRHRHDRRDPGRRPRARSGAAGGAGRSRSSMAARASSTARASSRAVPTAPWLSIFANQVLTGVTNLLFGGRLTDMETCYKVMDARHRAVAQPRIEPLRHRARDHRQAAARRPLDSRAADPLRAAQPRAGQEDRLARRRARDSGAASSTASQNDPPSPRLRRAGPRRGS